MDNYLEKCKNQMAKLSEVSEPIELVLGNESCDLDSAVSAIGWAFVKYFSSNTNETNKRIVIPILNITRSELKLRKEILFWFKHIHLNWDQLICKDDIDFETLKTKEVLITLVDHNSNQEMVKLGQIIEIIDHHKYNNNELPVSDPKRVLIDLSVGSCSTLIAERFLTSDLKTDPNLRTPLALMFYGTIILDTINFSKSAQKFSERDEKVIQHLEDIIADKSITRSEVYEQLIDAKNSINDMSLEELLLKDKKFVECVPNIRIIISSISGRLVSDLNLENKRKLLREFASNQMNRFDVVMILGIDNRSTDYLRRDLAVFSEKPTILETIALRLESESVYLNLDLILKLNDLRLYTQLNVKSSRKVILPLISSLTFEPKLKTNQTNGTDNEYNKSPNKKKLLKVLSTADVDPDFVLNYIPETVDFLESPEYSSMETEALKDQFFPSSPSKETSNGSPISKESAELEIPNIDVSKLNNNPESVYGSYIEDSFVGELVGDYPNSDAEKDTNDLENNWSLNNGINNEMEYDFDSFGPESIIYTGNNDSLVDQTFKHSISEETLIEETNSNELNTTQTSEQTKGEGLETNKTPVQSLLEIPSEKPTPESDISQSLSEERDDISPFKRNSSLTQSQRKKISPRINIQQILNSSDDLSPGINSSTPTSHPLSFSDSDTNSFKYETNDANNDNNANTLNTIEDNGSKGLVRRPSTTKKKIPVNRDFFTNDELNDKSKPEESSQPIEELTAKQELEESRAWKASCPIGPEGDVKPIDMKVIDPYKKVISHGGYFHSSTSIGNSHQSGASPAIIVFSACYLPDRSRKDYNYVMDNLFMYVLTTLHNLIADDYILIYFHNAGVSALGNNMPTFGWLKRCYHMIDRKLKKNLKGLYLVHPTFWLKTLIIMSKPFISSKFSRKLKFISTLTELSDLLPIENIAIPEPVKMTDSQVMTKKNKSRRITQK